MEIYVVESLHQIKQRRAAWLLTNRMNIIFEVLMTEIEQDTEKTVYNNIYWKLKHNKFKMTHFVERYDDCNEHTATYDFYREDTLVAYGEGDPLPHDKVGYGGVSVFVQLISPEYSVLVGVGK